MTTPTFEPVELPSKYAKAIVAIVTAVLTVFAGALVDNVVDTVDGVNVLIAFLTAFGVYAVPNFDRSVGVYLKVVIAFVGTGAQALVPFLMEGSVSPAQWLVVGLAAIGALGVGIVPNAPAAVVTVQALDPDTRPRSTPL